MDEKDQKLESMENRENPIQKEVRETAEQDNVQDQAVENPQIPEKSGKAGKVVAGTLIAALVAANIYVNVPVVRKLIIAGSEVETTEAPETEEISELITEVPETVSEKSATVQVKGAAETAATNKETAAPQTDASETQEAEIRETENWKNTVFGDKASAVVSSLSVSGLTTAQKEKAGYRESDFVRSLAAFLSDSGVSAKSVEFKDEVTVSSPSAYAFWATLDGNDDQALTVVMYPAYPGEYLFTLQDAQVKLVTLQTETQAQSESQAQVQTPAQTPAQTVQTEPVYNAATLSVTGIPSTLSNYLNNPTELQYTLYGWLWNSGKKSIASASVDSYSIDPDARTATISMTLSDGSKVTGTYALDSNSYSYK